MRPGALLDTVMSRAMERRASHHCGRTTGSGATIPLVGPGWVSLVERRAIRLPDLVRVGDQAGVGGHEELPGHGHRVPGGGYDEA